MKTQFVLRSRVEAAKAQNGFTYANFVHRDDLIPLVQVKEAIKEYLTNYGAEVSPQQLQTAITQYIQSANLVTQTQVENLIQSAGFVTSDQLVSSIQNYVQSANLVSQSQVEALVQALLDGIDIPSMIQTQVAKTVTQAIFALEQNPHFYYWQTSLYQEHGSSRLEIKSTYKTVPGSAFYVQPDLHPSLLKFIVGVEVQNLWEGTLKCRFVGKDNAVADLVSDTVTLKDEKGFFKFEILTTKLWELFNYDLSFDSIVFLRFSADGLQSDTKVYLESLVMERIKE